MLISTFFPQVACCYACSLSKSLKDRLYSNKHHFENEKQRMVNRALGNGPDCGKEREDKYCTLSQIELKGISNKLGENGEFLCLWMEQL